MARVSKPSSVTSVLTRRPRSARNVEHVGAGEHADRVTAVEHEHRGAALEPVDDVGDGLADAEHRRRRLHQLADRAVEHAGSRNALSISGSSDTVPDTSFAASGSSVVIATTSCDTPSSRMQRERVARRRRRAVITHEVGDRAVLRREHVAGGRALACAGTRSRSSSSSSKIFDR